MKHCVTRLRSSHVHSSDLYRYQRSLCVFRMMCDGSLQMFQKSIFKARFCISFYGDRSYHVEQRSVPTVLVECCLGYMGVLLHRNDFFDIAFNDVNDLDFALYGLHGLVVTDIKSWY